MAKKISIGLGAIALIAVPLVVLAQFPKAEMSSCCQLNRAITNCGIENQWMVDPAIAVGGTCYSKGSPHTVVAADNRTPDWGGCCTMDAVYTATDFIFWFFIAFVVIMGIYTGVMFMTAGGDPGKIEKARSMLMYLVIGIIVAVAVKLIPSLARAIIGV